MNKKSLIWIVGIIIILLIAGGIVFEKDADETAIKVGAILPLSGFASASGQEMQNGMEMCNPGNIYYIYEDSAAVSATGVTAFNKLTQIDNVDLTIVGMSAVAEGVLPLAKEKGNFVLASIVSSADYGIRGGENVFRYFTDGGKEAEEVSQFLIDKFDIDKAGILYLNNDYGLTYKLAMQNFFDKNSLTLISNSFGPNDADFSVQLLKMKKEEIKHIFVVAYDKQTLQVIKQAKELGMDVVLITSWFLADPNLQKANKELIEGVYFTIPEYYFDSEKIIEFKADYKERYNKEPNIYSTIGCDLSVLIGKNNIKTPEQLRKLNSFKGLNGNIDQTEGGEFIFPVKMAIFSNGSTEILN